MLPEEKIVLVLLADATLRAPDILGVVKYTQPATLQTPEVSCNVIYLIGLQQPIVLAYETLEKREEEFDTVRKAMVEVVY